MTSVTENTPLLATRQDEEPPIVRPIRHPWNAYFWIFGSLALLVSFIYNYRLTLPRPLSQVEAMEQDDFSGLHSYNQYLSHFNTPHSANQQGNTEMYHWISNELEQFAKVAQQNDIKVDLITNDTTRLVVKRDRYSQGEYWYVESRNVMIRLHGQQGSIDNALLVNAHYDSVSTSHGVTDNGMGTATALELLNYFSQHPPRNTMIFLFNNYEEGGLIGAQSFIHHPWFSTIKLFVNLEGTGSGGRSLLFRSSNLDAVKKLASSRAHLLHGSPFGNDMLKSKLIRSDTDYTTFTGKGVPGLDIAFYTPRAHYHTQRDDLVHTTPSSLQYMGQMALGVVRALDEDDIDDPPMEKFIYFDILGRIMLVYSFTTSQAMNIFMLVSTPLVALIWLAILSRDHDNKKKFWLEALMTFSQGLAAVLIAIVLIIGVDALAIYALLQLKPLLTYGNAYIVAFYLVLASLLGLTLSQLVLTRIKRMHRALLQLNTSLYGLVAVWWGILVGATVMGSTEVAGGYFAIFFLTSGIAAIIVSHLLAMFYLKAKLFGVFVVQMALPVILMTEFCFLSLDALRHTTADGTPELSIYVIVATPIILITLHLLPWIHVSGDKRQPVGVFTLALVVVFISCLLLSPFNRQNSPNRIVFYQEYDQIESTATVRLVTGRGLDNTLAHYLTAEEAATLWCDQDDYQMTCTYQTKDVPMYAHHRDETKLDINDHDGQRLQITTTVQHSHLCQLKMNTPILKAQVNGEPILPNGDDMQAIMTYVNQAGHPVRWDIEVEKDHHNLTVQLSCLYDDWTRGELPAFTNLRNRLPETQALTIKGGTGLAMVHYPVVYIQ
ncbi:hypothetical protein BC941DRAFT_432655 [Chlamydoabsidia padenii]|nr:hypothetical protein BC941DRAFT_432655 [Chlamydoabsidia padenii]